MDAIHNNRLPGAVLSAVDTNATGDPVDPPMPRVASPPDVGMFSRHIYPATNDQQLLRIPAGKTCPRNHHGYATPDGLGFGCMHDDTIFTPSTVAGVATKLIHFILDEFQRPIPLLYSSSKGIYTEQYSPSGVLMELPVNQPVTIYQTNDPSIFAYPKPVFTRAPAPYVLERDGDNVQMYYVREIEGRSIKLKLMDALFLLITVNP